MSSKACSLLAALLITLTGATGASAQQQKPPQQKVLTSLGKLELELPTATVKVAGRGAAGPIVTQGPAPALSRIIVYAVGSTQYGGWERMTSINQLSTVGDHVVRSWWQ